MNRPIGIFDSGIGGLTVARSLSEQLPHEQLIYLGDTARVPYGSKSSDTVTRYARMAAHFLLRRGVKLIVVACNTASAFAVERLKQELDIPILGVIEPGAQAAVAATRSGRIGVIGTLGTVRSEAYSRAIFALDASLTVTARACPLLVPLAEEGWLDDRISEAIAHRYLAELHAERPDIDVLVLGCTHYPLLRPVLERVAYELFGPQLVLIDSAQAIAEATRVELERSSLARSQGQAQLDCCVTDEARFAEVGERFLGKPIGTVERVDLLP